MTRAPGVGALQDLLVWYLRFSLSYRDVEELLAERGLHPDHVTVWRWVQRYAPEMERRWIFSPSLFESHGLQIPSSGSRFVAKLCAGLDPGLFTCLNVRRWKRRLVCHGILRRLCEEGVTLCEISRLTISDGTMVFEIIGNPVKRSLPSLTFFAPIRRYHCGKPYQKLGFLPFRLPAILKMPSLIGGITPHVEQSFMKRARN
jgi:hypothetical protein